MTTADYQLNRAVASPVVAQRPCLDITVVIPTYNGADRIPQVLDRLKQQLNMGAITWEVVVCDNNSSDRTADVVVEYQHSWPQDSSLRYCFVAEQGAAFARQRGVIEAYGQLVAFLDDDNIPAQDWLNNVYRFANAYPKAGAFGSQIHGDFQGTLPEGFQHIACFLAIVERGNKPHLYNPSSKILPPAAGLAVRRDVWLQAVPERLFLNHKGKSAGLASEDLEAMLHIQKAGWEIWYNSDMVVTHQIPSTRLQEEYLVALLRCVGLSRFYIRWLGTKDWQRFFKVPAYIANDLRKLAFHYLKHGPQPTTSNILSACERSLLTSTLVSPAFLLRKAYQDFWQNRLDNVRLPERQQWLQRLTDAFENRRLDLYQQEVIFLGGSTAQPTVIPQFEVLLRLGQGASQRPPVSPAYFFPTAERYGLMRTLDRRVIQQVCETVAVQPSAGVYTLNLSAASLSDPSFPKFLEEQLRRSQIRPENLWFEISESMVMDSLPEMQRLMDWMKTLGFGVTIDEVTRSPEAAGYLSELPKVNCLKVSKNLLERPTELTAWIDLSHTRDVQLVAKGVENQSVLEQVQALGVAYAQGYQLAQPLPLAPRYTP